MHSKAISVAIAALLVSGCATMPDVTASYYLPQAETGLVVTETLGCDGAGERLISAASVVATTTYHSNSSKRETVNLSQFGGQLKDVDVAINTTPDGRLTGVNAASSGELASILKSGVSLASALGLGLVAFDGARGVDVKAACKEITTLAGAKSSDGSGKLLTLTYSATFTYSDDGRTIIFPAAENAPSYPQGGLTSATLLPDPSNPDLGHALSFLKTAFRLEYSGPVDEHGKDRSTALATWAHVKGAKLPRGFQPLTLNMVGEGSLTVRGPGDNFEPASRPIWVAKVSIPVTDESHTFELPVPSGMYFGKQGFALGLSDSGAITKLQYSANSGASESLDAAASIVGLVPTTAAKATAQKDQADLIYQQQRLIKCKLSADSCPSS